VTALRDGYALGFLIAAGFVLLGVAATFALPTTRRANPRPDPAPCPA